MNIQTFNNAVNQAVDVVFDKALQAGLVVAIQAAVDTAMEAVYKQSLSDAIAASGVSAEDIANNTNGVTDRIVASVQEQFFKKENWDAAFQRAYDTLMQPEHFQPIFDGVYNNLLEKENWDPMFNRVYAEAVRQLETAV